MDPLPNNTRYVLELERKDLLAQEASFEEKYAVFVFAFTTSFQASAIIACVYTFLILTLTKQNRTKINTIIAIYSFLNSLVFFENFTHAFKVHYVPTIRHVTEMMAALARTYGTTLMVAWLYVKFVGKSKGSYSAVQNFLILVPALTWTGFIFYYFHVNEFIYEVYGPGSDVLHVVVYTLVIVIYVLCKIFVGGDVVSTSYPLLVALVNLITNFPYCLILIYLRFALDIGWVYRYKIYFVELFIELLLYSNAFYVLFLVVLYNENIRARWFRSKLHRETSIEEIQVVKH